MIISENSNSLLALNRKLDLDISDNEIKERTTRWKPRESKYTRGVLSKYAKLVSSAAEGAICR